jgi:hypothetical protein
MAVGRRPGGVARRLLGPTGWPTRLAFVIGTAAVACATRPQLGPVGQWDLAPVDLRLDPWWLDAAAVRTPTDAAYAAGLWLWAIGLGWLVARTLLRLAVRWRYDVGDTVADNDAAADRDASAKPVGERARAASGDGHLKSRDREGVEQSNGSVLATGTTTKSSSDTDAPSHDMMSRAGVTSQLGPAFSTPGPAGRPLDPTRSTAPLPDGRGSLNAQPSGRLADAGMARRRLRRPAQRRSNRPNAATFVAFCGLAVATVACVLVGWPYRVGQRAAAEYRDVASRNPSGRPPSPQLTTLGLVRPPLMQGRPDRDRRVLAAAVHQSSEPQVRLAALAMTSELLPEALGDAARDGSRWEADPTVLEWHVRLMGVLGDPELVGVTRRLLWSPDLRLRTASLDAIRIAADADRVGDDWEVRFATRPRVGVSRRSASGTRTSGGQIVTFGSNDSLVLGKPRHAGPTSSFPDDVLRRVTELLADGADDDEREAAARAALRPNPGSDGGSVERRMRVAEWGVRQDPDPAAGTDPRIPPFIPRYDGAAEVFFGPTIPAWQAAQKSAVQFTVDAPTAVSLVVQVRKGLVTSARPKPDDYSFAAKSFFRWQSGVMVSNLGSDRGFIDIAALYGWGGPALTTAVPAFAECRMFPPYLAASLPGAPERPAAVTFVKSGGWDCDAIGFRWDTLIVTPERRPWMSPPALPPNPKFAWWSRLRDVPCSWVSSRGEAERFLYYDGPTLLPPPVRVRAAGAGVLTVEPADDPRTTGDEERADGAGTPGIEAMTQTARKGRRRERRGMWVEVRPADAAGGGSTGRGPAVSAEVVPVPAAGKPPPSPTHTLGTGRRLVGPAAEAELRAWVVDAGLTGPEADGMMAAWHEAFFAKPGRRFVLLLSAVDYDSLCPLQVRPTPTEMARVGLVWTKLPAAAGE